MVLSEIRQAVLETGLKMIEMGLAAGTYGNISARVDSNYMIVTPSGMDYGSLKAGDMVCTNIHDLSYEGSLKPSIEVALHAEIYKARPEINAVLHTHSTNASIVAAARKEIPPILDDMVQIIGGAVRIADYALPGSEGMARNAVEKLEGRTAVILANHGPVCLGRNLREALLTAQIVEKSAAVYIGAQAIGGAVSLDEQDIAFMRNYFLQKYGQGK